MFVSLSKARICALVVMATVFLSACGGSQQAPVQNQTTQAGETALRSNANALAKTVLEGSALGAATGFGLGLTLGDDEDDGPSGFRIGLGGGAVTGSYVAVLQRKYSWKEQRLDQVLKDLRANNALLEATLVSMQSVLVESRAALNAEQAQQNLGVMRKAITGAEARRVELGAVRSLDLDDGSGRSVAPELALMAERIAAMRAIAAEMETLG